MIVDRLELLVCKASPDLKVLPVFLAPRVNAVYLVPRENRAILEQLVTLVRLVLLVFKDCLDLRVLAVKAELRETKV